MQIQIMKPSADGKHYPNYDEMIKNSRDPEEIKCLNEVKANDAEYKEKGYPEFRGFPFGIVYTQKMACGHYELFQHPIYRDFGKEPTDDNILDSVEDVIRSIKEAKRIHQKCTRCICDWR